MARSKLTTPEEQTRRARGFELYCSLDANGDRPNIRAIAHTLGVTAAAVRYWFRADEWESKLSEINRETALVTNSQKQSLKATLRQGTFDAILELRRIVKDAQAAADDRVKAAQAIFKMAKDSNAIDLELMPDVTAPVLKFSDDLPGKGIEPSSTSAESSTSSAPCSEADSTLPTLPSEPPTPSPGETSSPMPPPRSMLLEPLQEAPETLLLP